MRYTYTVTIADFECECADVKGVVEAINNKAGFSAVTKDMVHTVLTRPHKANKRLLTTETPLPGQIRINRKQLPSRDEVMRAELVRVNAVTEALLKD
jgi:hypothetical protein